MTHLDLTPFYRSAIGFDRMANLVDGLFQTPDNSQPNWPPYNIEKKGETRYGITMAVAGFSEDDLDIVIHEQKLIITGKIAENDTEEESPEYLYRGIATRQFERRFQLADFIHIKGASLQDGLLHIDLEREVPEAMKPRKIDIVNQAKLTAPKK
ncbi:MAG: Small heat shock protein IbpA [Alphaproteobacteria bacterium UBA4588]|nr:MAG: Small heat shock protein IbpA [Alphaproteobacteria bacterium UBA4588]